MIESLTPPFAGKQAAFLFRHNPFGGEIWLS
jgi:hypothetical protein